MLIPELPAFITALGGAQYKGLNIALFTLTAMLSRPFSGKLADKIGRVPVIMAGAAVCILCSLVYPFITTVAGLLFLRLVHGFSTGFTPTGQTAYLADIIPIQRRGEAMGILGTAGSIGMASGPAIGGLVANQFGLPIMFYCSSAFAVVSVLVVLGIKETLPTTQAFRLTLLKINKTDLFEPRVITPCVVMVLIAYAYGAMVTLLPDFGEHLSIKNKGILFTYLTVASLVVRLIGGKASDRWGRKPVLFAAVSSIAVAMFIIALAETQFQLIVGVVVYGFAQGTASPTLLAWATDLSDERYKGRGISSLYIFMELGIGLGAVFSVVIYANDAANFFLTFISCMALAVLGVMYLIVERSSIRIQSKR